MPHQLSCGSVRPGPSPGPAAWAAALNRDCPCASEPGAADPYRTMAEGRPHLFSPSPVFITEGEREAMQAIVAAVEEAVATPGYRARALAQAPAIARVEQAALGAFMGYDFHLAPEGPRLIEINTNAGGGLVTGMLAASHAPCCAEVARMARGAPPLAALETEYVGMFLQEWRSQRAGVPLRSIAIVDDAPAAQYLYPEFVLFRDLFERHGIRAVIADAAELRFEQDLLIYGDQAIDLVYNRITDFALERPEHAALRKAYLSGAAVLTPHPRAHALYADKRNLALLRDAAASRAAGVSEASIAVLQAGVPATVSVTADNAAALWERRRRLFFKPAAGYGSKAAYRGDKLTRRVWSEVLAGRYVAQALVPPSERRVLVAGEPVTLKADLRAYAYAGRVQLIAARLYQGQTTNLRTPGGGFANVFITPGAGAASCGSLQA
jgi:hypothetical protein